MRTYSSSRAARLENGVRQVQTILGPSVNVSGKSIEDSLWHYYYDVDKTVNYLLRKLPRSSNIAQPTALEQQAPAVPVIPLEDNQTLSRAQAKRKFYLSLRRSRVS